MVRKTFSVFAVILVAASLLWASNDPWKSKPYEQWDEKDIRRIFDDSPWSKVVQVGVSSAVDSATPVDTSNRTQSGRGGMGGQYPQGSATPSPQSGQATQSNQTPYVVRWASSRTIREAAVRKAVLDGKAKQEDGAKELAQPVETYQVVVAGPDMKPFDIAEADNLKRGTYLYTRKTKEKISPSEVQIIRSPDGASIQNVIFSFPKKSATGESTIAADEKGADFFTAPAGIKISTSFDFSKMMDSQGRDL
jgi:hypothetical protein